MTEHYWDGVKQQSLTHYNIVTAKFYKHALHNIHRLSWDPYARGTPGNCPACPSSNTALVFGTYYMYVISYRRQCHNDIENLSTSSCNMESSQRSTIKFIVQFLVVDMMCYIPFVLPTFSLLSWIQLVKTRLIVLVCHLSTSHFVFHKQLLDRYFIFSLKKKVTYDVY